MRETIVQVTTLPVHRLDRGSVFQGTGHALGRGRNAHIQRQDIISHRRPSSQIHLLPLQQRRPSVSQNSPFQEAQVWLAALVGRAPHSRMELPCVEALQPCRLMSHGSGHLGYRRACLYVTDRV